jgi:flagellar protein FlbT
MYVGDKDVAEKHNIYWALVKEVMAAAPTTSRLIAQVSENVLNDRYYQALKIAKKLIEYEQETMEYARNNRTQRV